GAAEGDEDPQPVLGHGRGRPPGRPGPRPACRRARPPPADAARAPRPALALRGAVPYNHGVGDGFDYELLVIGSGPAGQRAAVQAAKLRRRAAIVERRSDVGGACVNTGTIPSKTIREAIIYLTGLNQRGVYGQAYRLKDEISIQDIAVRTRQVVERERSVIRDQLVRNHVAVLEGEASFVDPHTMSIAERGGGDRRVAAERIVIAAGSEPDHPAEIHFNGSTILDSDDVVLRLQAIPDTLVVVGAGVIG